MKSSTDTNIVLKAIDFELKKLLQKDIERFKMLKQNKRTPVEKAA